MFRIFVLFAILACVFSFTPANRIVRRSTVEMKAVNPIQKALGVAAMGIALAGPVSIPNSANADGAVSKSTVFRARNNYGAKIMSLEKSVANGEFAAFDKSVANWFDLFISGSNALPSAISKATKAEVLIFYDVIHW